MIVFDMDKKPDISYITYGEIVKLALDNKFGNDDSVVNELAQLDFAEQLIMDINVAIEEREIIPINIEKPSSCIGNNRYYKDRIMPFLIIAFSIGSISITKYVWDQPGFKTSVLLNSPDVDLVRIVISIFTMVAVAALIPLLTNSFKYFRILYLSLNSDSPSGMIKYQLQEAKYRGYTKTGYYTNSVEAFLNSMYGFNIGEEKQDHASVGSNFDYESHDASDETRSWRSNPLFTEGGILSLTLVPRDAKLDKEISEKMRRLADVKHASRNTAKERIGDFIKREIVPPCTCYHNQIARYIIKNKDVDGFEAKLVYIPLNSPPKSLKDSDVMDIAKKVMKDYDPGRVYNRTIALNKCSIHKTM